MVKFSVITICFNDKKGLEKTIESVVGQTFSEFEYIVIDGGSDDGSVQAIQKHDGYIDFWISEKDNGIFHAMNKGIKQANGKYLLFLNSGDYLADNYVMESLSKTDLQEDIVSGNLKICDRNNGTSYIKNSPEKITGKYLMTDYLPHPATLIKKKLFYEFGFYNEANRIVSDWEFFLKAFLHHNAGYQKISLCISVFNACGMSSDKNFCQLITDEKENILFSDFFYIWEDYQSFRELEKRFDELLNTKEYKFFLLFMRTGILRFCTLMHTIYGKMRKRIFRL